MSLPPVNRRRRDWFWVLRTLMRYGVSMGQVARACGRDVGAVKHWQDGGEPKESDARIVLALLAKHAPDEYRMHQAQFDIRWEMDNLTRPGDQRRLGFVEVN
jgi:hypothetical protein